MYLLHNMIIVYGNKYYFIQNMGDKKNVANYNTIAQKSPF